jgi:hypothetical protein
MPDYFFRSRDGKDTRTIHLPYSSNTLENIALTIKYLNGRSLPKELPSGLDPAIQDGLAFLREKNLIDNEGLPYQRLYQKVSVVFNGPGFYVTDNRPKLIQQK